MTMFSIANQVNLDAARVGFHAAFLEQLGLVDEQPLESLLLEVPSATSLEEWEWLGDMPGMEEWLEDRNMATLSAFKLRVKNRDWASGLRLHQNQFKDDKLGLFAPQISMLASAARAHRTEFAAQLLINGFDGAAFPLVSNGLAYDGKFFFDTTRVTGSNKLTTALDLSGAGLDQAEILLGSQTTYDGRRKLRGIQGDTLIVGPSLRPTADRLMTNDFLANTGGVANSTGTISNPFKGRYKVVVEPWLVGAYANDWFLACTTKPFKPLLFQMREDISTSAILGAQGGTADSVPRFQKGELWFGAEARYNVAGFEPRLIVGSKP